MFILGERAAAQQLVQALDGTPTFCAMPTYRLLADLVHAVDRYASELDQLTALAGHGFLLPATWYREVQAARLRDSGKVRTVEFSGLSILRLCELFPRAQFLVVHQLKRSIPRSRRLPAWDRVRIFEIDSDRVTAPESLERALAFLGEATAPVVLDLSDRRVTSSSSHRPGVEGARRER